MSSSSSYSILRQRRSIGLIQPESAAKAKAATDGGARAERLGPLAQEMRAAISGVQFDTRRAKGGKGNMEIDGEGEVSPRADLPSSAHESASKALRQSEAEAKAQAEAQAPPKPKPAVKAGARAAPKTLVRPKRASATAKTLSKASARPKTLVALKPRAKLKQ